MMMPAWPAAPFVVVQSQFLFELLVVLLHSPPEFSQPHQAPQRDLLRQVREPILGGRFGFPWPLDQQPDRWHHGPVSNMAMRRLHPAGSKAAPLGACTALASRQRAVGRGGACSREPRLCGNVPHPRSRPGEGTTPSPTAYSRLLWSDAPPPRLGSCPPSPAFPNTAVQLRPTLYPAWENRCHRQSIPPPAATLPPCAVPANGAPVPRPRGSAPRIVARPERCLPVRARPEAQSTCPLRPAAVLAHTTSRDGDAPSVPHWPASLPGTPPTDSRRRPALGHSCLQSLRRSVWTVNKYLT